MRVLRRLEEGRTLGRLWSRPVLAPPAWSRWWIVGLACVAVVLVADVAVGSRAALTSALAVAALLPGVWGRRGDAAVVAPVAVLVAVVSGVWNGWGVAYTVGVVVVGSAAVVAVVVALGRANATASERQLSLLRDLLALARSSSDVQTIVERLLDLLVPAMADVASLDLLLDGRHRRLATRAAGPDRERVEATLAGREIAGGGGRLVGPYDERLLRAVARDEEDLARLRSLGLRWTMFLPLVTRGEPFGGLTLATTTSERRYTQADFEFAELVAGRVAIVLDHVGLTQAVERSERRMVAALDTLDEAVTMNGPDGRTVYVNDAAVRLLKAASAEELINAPVGDISARFALYDEAGEPLDYHSLPAFRALAGEDQPPAMLVRNVVRVTGEERWLLNKVSVLRDEHGHVDRVVNVIEDLTEIKQAELRERLLGDASRALSRSLDYERTLQQVAEVAVPELADWCGVDLPGTEGRIDSVAVAHVDPARLAVGRELRERYPVRLDSDTDLARVIREGGTARIERIRDEDLVAFAADADHLRLLRGVGFGSILIVPLVAGGEPLGALTLVRSDPLRRFSATDVTLAEELGRRAGIAVLNARLYGERTRIAQELQAGVRPPELLPFAGLQVATLYRPASQVDDVGGDFYDAFATLRGWMVVIGDVAGQGARAAALTGLARYTLRSVGQLTGDPLAAVGQVNRTLRDQPEMSLCTVAVLLLHRDEAGRAAVAAVSCGHPLPVLIRDRAPAELGVPGALLGAFDDPEARLVSTPLAEGDALVLYTDGVLDAVGADGRFGDARLRALLHGPAEHADAVVRRVDEALSAFQAGPQADDTAVVAIAVRDVAALTEALPDDPRLAPQRPANGL